MRPCTDTADADLAARFGANLSRLLAERSMRKAELARRLKIGEPSLSRFCRGLATPSLRTLLRIADTLDVSTDELLQEQVRDSRGKTSSDPTAYIKSACTQLTDRQLQAVEEMVHAFLVANQLEGQKAGS